MRWWCCLATWLLCLLCTPALWAQTAPPTQTDANACVASFGKAQELRDAGKLRAERKALVTCSQPSCPKIIVDKCMRWLSDNRTNLPTIIIAARDARGRDSYKVRVFVDGRKRADRLDGRPMAIDPGPHTLTFHEQASGRQIKRRIVVVQGKKNRLITVRFSAVRLPEPSLVPAKSDPGKSRVPVVSWVAYGVAAAGLVTGIVAGAVTLSKSDELRSQCEGSVCPEAQRDSHERALALAHVSTAGFAIAGVGAAVGTVVLLTSKPAKVEVGLSSLRLSFVF